MQLSLFMVSLLEQVLSLIVGKNCPIDWLGSLLLTTNKDKDKSQDQTGRQELSHRLAVSLLFFTLGGQEQTMEAPSKLTV